jgi:hypothetical protein
VASVVRAIPRPHNSEHEGRSNATADGLAGERKTPHIRSSGRETTVPWEEETMAIIELLLVVAAVIYLFGDDGQGSRARGRDEDDVGSEIRELEGAAKNQDKTGRVAPLA